MTTPRTAAVPGRFGVGEALDAGQAALRTIAEGLAAYERARVATMREPLHLDSARLALLAYREALRGVRRRFWTTTSLSSEFWSGEHDSVMASNRRLLENLPPGSGAARRLFLLTAPAELEVRRRRDERVLLRKHGDERAVAEFDERIRTLRLTCESLSAHGCELRAVFDRAPRYEGELAIYDDWRFDLFRTSRSGTIASVDVHTPVTEGFEDALRAAAEYFELLWGAAAPLSALLDRIDEAVARSESRIDYDPNWLARYEHGLPTEDELLKRSECRAVEEQLARHGMVCGLRRVLDVGTCTGRYPVRLREAVVPDGEIVGVDNDEDAVRFARRNVAALSGGDARIRIEHLDFCSPEASLAGPFDLVTCMLGTLAHFPRGETPREPFADDLQRALERFASLLAQRGLLFFTVWTESARLELRVLSIYSEADKQRLARWDVSAGELLLRLHAAGLRVVAQQTVEQRLELYCCARAV